MEKQMSVQQALEAIQEANEVLSRINAQADETMAASLSAYVAYQKETIEKARSVIEGNKNALALASKNALLAKDAEIEKELRAYLDEHKPTLGD